MKQKVYIDMDGVLCDFLGAVSTSLNIPIKTHQDWEIHREACWQTIAQQGESFWANLKWLPGAKKMWESIEAICDPIILSAYPTIKDMRQDAIIGKILWLSGNISDKVAMRAIICHVSEKQLYKGNNNIIIDDNKQTIDQWHPSTGILHIDPTNSMNKLLKIIKNNNDYN